MNKDFREFFALLNARAVEFLVIGGVAYNYYAPPRSTKDIDLWVNPDRPNLERLLGAITDFGFPTSDLEIDDLSREQRVIMLGRVPNRIDILTRPDGLDWDKAWSGRTHGNYGDTEIAILSRRDLIECKRTVGRPRDLADAAMLEEIERRDGERSGDQVRPNSHSRPDSRPERGSR